MPLTLLPPHPTRDDSLVRRLDELDFHRRFKIAARTGAVLLSAAVVLFLTAAIVDHLLNVPSFLRALGLIAVPITIRYVWRRTVTDAVSCRHRRLAAALRIEKRYPRLNDTISSAVWFFEQDDADSNGRAFRSATIRRAERIADRYDLDAAFRVPFLGRAVLSAMVAATVLGVVFVLAPGFTGEEARRLFLPVGSSQAIQRTRIVIVAPDRFPHRMAAGDPLDVTVRISRSIPDRCVLQVQTQAGEIFDQIVTIDRDRIHDGTLQFIARIDGSRTRSPFRIRVRTSLVETPWFSVVSTTPPALAPLNGRPSPQTELTFPRYTRMAPRSAPDGSLSFDAVTGTQVRIRGAVDRPIADVRIHHQVESDLHSAVRDLTAFAATDGLSDVSRRSLLDVINKPISGTLSAEGREFVLDYVPRLTGFHVLTLTDDQGVSARKLLDIRLAADPAPRVMHDHPNLVRVTPSGTLRFGYSAHDDTYGLRRVSIEYADESNVRFELKAMLDVPEAERMARTVMGIPAEFGTNIIPAVLKHSGTMQLSVRDLVDHLGRFPQAGTTRFIRVIAEDFDDVTALKSPGSSTVIEVRIVDRREIESQLDEQFGDLLERLRGLAAIQKRARETAEGSRTEKLDANERQNRLQQIEQLQRRIRERLNHPDEGIFPLVDRAGADADRNRLGTENVAERMRAAGRELRRLESDELNRIDELLPRTRQESKPGVETGRLIDAQRAAELRLQELLDGLEPWSGAAEVRGRLRELADEIEREADRQARSPIASGASGNADRDRRSVDWDRTAERVRLAGERLNRSAVERRAVADEAKNKADRMLSDADQADRAAKETPPSQPDVAELRRRADRLRTDAIREQQRAAALASEAEALERAVRMGAIDEAREAIQRGTTAVRSSRETEATGEQRSAANALRRTADMLDRSDAKAPDLLAKRKQAIRDELNAVIDAQERLQKKAEAADARSNPADRSAQRQQLAAEQREIRNRLDELKRRMDRDGERNGAQLDDAIREMERSADLLTRGESGTEKMDDVLDRLDTAVRDVQRPPAEPVEQLRRDRAEKLAEKIKALCERQERLRSEMERLHTTAEKAGKWDRPLRTSLNDLKKQQNTLAEETVATAEKSLGGLVVIERIVRQSAEAMRMAARRIDARIEISETGPYDRELENISQSQVLGQQQMAESRLRQILDSLKNEPATPKSTDSAQKNDTTDPQNPPGADPKPPELIPPTAQLKLLLELQKDVADRTAKFDRLHPDRATLDDDDRAELQLLERMQRDIGDLIKELTLRPIAEKLP